MKFKNNSSQFLHSARRHLLQRGNSCNAVAPLRDLNFRREKNRTSLLKRIGAESQSDTLRERLPAG
jgi:hypothetical protein